MVEFHDTLILDGKARRLSTGELAASVRCARTGLQDYTGAEVGKPELSRVTVYRPEAEVMKRDSLATFAGVPVTIEHPRESVTTDNWKQYAVGEAGDEVVRDGEFIRVPILVRDEAAIQAIQDGKRQISMGYSCSLEFVDGVTPSGQPYQAIQRDIKINHLAVVDRARGGDALTVEDERTYSARSNANTNDPSARRETRNPSGGGNPTRDGEVKMPHTLIIDGLQVTEVSDQAKAAIEKLQGQVRVADEAKTKAEGEVAKLTTDNSSLEAKVTTLEQQVKDAKLTPQQLRDAAKAFGRTVETAKKLVSSLTIGDDADEASIRRAVVTAKLGDASKDWNDEQVSVSFNTLAAQVSDSGIDPVRNALSGGVQTIGDAKGDFEKAHQKYRSNLSDGWKQPAANAA